MAHCQIVLHPESSRGLAYRIPVSVKTVTLHIYVSLVPKMSIVHILSQNKSDK